MIAGHARLHSPHTHAYSHHNFNLPQNGQWDARDVHPVDENGPRRGLHDAKQRDGEAALARPCGRYVRVKSGPRLKLRKRKGGIESSGVERRDKIPRHRRFKQKVISVSASSRSLASVNMRFLSLTRSAHDP